MCGECRSVALRREASSAFHDACNGFTIGDALASVFRVENRIPDEFALLLRRLDVVGEKH